LTVLTVCSNTYRSHVTMGMDGSVCRLSVKLVGLYCEKTAPVGTSSTNCFVFVCSKKF